MIAMNYLDSTYRQVCNTLLNVAKIGGIDHSCEGLMRAEEAYRTLKTANPPVEQLEEIAKSIGYDDESYINLVKNCRKK